METVRVRVVESPLGPLTLAGRSDRLQHLRMSDQTYEPSRVGWQRDDDAFGAVVEQLDEYFAGRLREFTVDLDMAGTQFQLRVWQALRTIPYGETRSYGQIASQIGSAGASRAVGLANGHNPISVIVPCHRVIGANGSLTGYGGGLERKKQLLAIERNQTNAIATLFD